MLGGEMRGRDRDKSLNPNLYHVMKLPLERVHVCVCVCVCEGLKLASATSLDNRPTLSYIPML